MNKTLARMLIALSLAVVGYFLLSLVSAISQIADFADRAIPGAATWLFWGLIVVFAGLLLFSLRFFFSLPKPPIPPSEDDPTAMRAYQETLRGHLQRNPLLTDVDLASDDGLSHALARLGEEADGLVKRTASTVFVSTAVMQNGRLDGLFVLASQLRLVWRVAVIYRSRPSPRQLLHLYSNVAANVLIADNLQEVDFAEIATPIVAAIFPSIKGGIPGLQGISTLLVNSLANGAANAFLTLRIGLVAKAYCSALSTPVPGRVRRSATLEALDLVAGIVKEQGRRVVERSWQVVRDGVSDVAESAVDGVKGALRKTADATVGTVRTVGDTLGSRMHSIKELIRK